MYIITIMINYHIFLKCLHGILYVDVYMKWSEVKSLSHAQLFVTPWTVVYHAPPSMGFSRQEHWSELPFPSQGDLRHRDQTQVSHILGRCFTTCTTREVRYICVCVCVCVHLSNDLQLFYLLMPSSFKKDQMQASTFLSFGNISLQKQISL